MKSFNIWDKTVEQNPGLRLLQIPHFAKALWSLKNNEMIKTCTGYCLLVYEVKIFSKKHLSLCFNFIIGFVECIMFLGKTFSSSL